MKVLLVNKFYYLKGGSERNFFDTKEVLEKNGHKVVVFSMKHEKNEKSEYEKYFIDNVNFNTSKGILKSIGLMYSFKMQKKLEALIKKEKPDIAHLHNAYNQISPSIFKIFKKYKIPVVLTSHDYHIACPNYQMFTKGRTCERCKKYKFYNCVKYRCLDNNLLKSCFGCINMYFKKLFKFYEKGVDVVLGPSKFMGNKLIEWGYPKEKVMNLPYGVDLKIFNPRNYIKEDYILYFGRFSKEKGLNVLIEALKNLPDVKIKLMGDGPLKNELLELQKTNKNIEILSYKPLNKINELSEIVRKARFTVVPSVWYENYPMSVLESLACGTPVIGSNTGGIPEQVIDNKTGFIFNRGDSNDLTKKIKLLYYNNDLIAEFSKNSREFVEKNNSMENFYNSLIKIYNSLI